jgi:uncharacterized SAM-binding protein YcdF (DUF218 family)
MPDRELQLPSDDERRRDRALIDALQQRESVGERYARTGDATPAAPPRPTIRWSPTPDLLRDPAPVEVFARRRVRPWRWVAWVVVAATVTVALYGLVTFVQVWNTGRSDEARPVDAIVVMGAAQYDGRPSPQLAARLDHVVELWSRGLAPLVVVTGGNQPGDRFTEAEASAAYLVERGVPAEAIVAERTGSSTYESLANVAEQFGDRVETVLIVTDPYHALRSKLTAEEVGFDAYVSPTTTSVVEGVAEVRRQVGETAGAAIGRIIGFERLHGITG